jgi:hypothetical protein
VFTAARADEFAREWIAAWNSRDLGRILGHYSDDVVFSSPFVKSLGGCFTSAVCGREDLREYFESALDKFPALHFHLRAVLLGVETVTLLYDSVNGLLAAETMAWNAAGEIERVWAQYDRVE